MFCAIICGPARAAELVIPLWPDMKVETTAGSDKIQDRGTTTRPNRFIRDVRHAMLIVLPAEKPNGTAVVICCGGGYSGEAIDKEGYEVAKWLNSIDVTAIICQYRLPRPAETKDGKPLPLIDAQRAIQFVRSRASEWKIDPHRVGIMGFSAGGHLASSVITHIVGESPDSGDPINSFSARPDFAILGYPVISLKGAPAHQGSRRNLLGDNPDPAMVELYSNELHVTKETPPTFLFAAKDDKGVPVVNSEMFLDALKKAGVPGELHLFEKGGHGFGMGHGESEQWPKLCETWMRSIGMLAETKTQP